MIFDIFSHLLFRIAVPTVHTRTVVKITMKTVSGKASAFETPAVRGNEANTAAAKPRGSITIIKVLFSRTWDFSVESSTAIARSPKKTKERKTPKKMKVNEEKLTNRPVKKKKNERVKKLI